MKTKIPALALLAVFLGGCTSIQVRPVDASKHPIKIVYVQQNPKVKVEDLLRVVEDGFQRHGIGTKIATGEPPADSDYLLTYTATRSWDGVPWLKHVELRLKRGAMQVGSATYHHRGWFGVNKYAGTRTKLNPVIDEMLADFPEQ
jgi:hypothetical protein